MASVIAVLEVMWDWEAKTSEFGYTDRAPEYFRINGRNKTGSRLYSWLGHHDLLVTNACPDLVNSASGRGTPDVDWLGSNLCRLQPFSTLLVCGSVAQKTYSEMVSRYSMTSVYRTLFVPHPAARLWSTKGLEFTGRRVRQGSYDMRISFDKQAKAGVRCQELSL